MWPFRKKALTATADVSAALRAGWNPIPLLGGGARQRIVEAYQTAISANYTWLYRQSPAVRTVIDSIMRNMGQLDLRLFEEISQSERQPRPEHPAALSLRYPGDGVSGDKFIRQLLKDFLIADDAIAVMDNAPGGRIALNWVPIHLVQFLGSSMFRVDTYRIHDELTGQYTDVPAENVFHWHGENPCDPRSGLSLLETLRDVVAEDVALQQAIVELANAGLQGPVWAYRPLDAPNLTPATRKAFEEDLANRVLRRKPLVMEEGTELREFGVSPRDAQMLDVRKFVTERIAAAYGVPLDWLSGSQEARDAFYTDTLAPYCENLTRMLNQRILVEVYNWTAGCFEFNLDEKRMGDNRIVTLVSAAGAPILTRNESRAKINEPPLDGGDELITPANVIVGNNPLPAPNVMPIQDPNKPPQDGSYRTDQPAPGKALEAKADPLPQLHPGRKGDLDRQTRNIDLSQARFERYFERLERSLRDKSKKAASIDWDRWNRELSDDLFSLAEQIVEKEGTIYAFKFGGTFDMSLVPHYLRALADGAAKAFNAVIRGEIQSLGLDGAMNMRARHVYSAGVGFGGGATRWVRDEATDQSPYRDHRVKIWIADTDRHAEFDGQTIPFDGDWPGGFAPGQQPGCRCTFAIQ